MVASLGLFELFGPHLRDAEIAWTVLMVLTTLDSSVMDAGLTGQLILVAQREPGVTLRASREPM